MFHPKLLTMCASAVLTAGSFFFTAPPAQAAESPVYINSDREVMVRRINFGDLNLSRVEGQWTLNRRVHWAVRWMCSDAVGGFDADISTHGEEQACVSRASEQARPQIAAAVQRAREIAINGSSMIAATAIVLAVSP